jgi:uncharacterized membrane protein YjjB (DUF3815 family)
MILWNVLLIITVAVAIGVAFSLGSSWTERIILASGLCALVAYGFYYLTTNGHFTP